MNLRGPRPLAAALAVILACPAVAACGGGQHRSQAQRPQKPQASGPYHWLVPTTGPPPTVAAENSAAGTTAWRLPGPLEDIGGLDRGDVSGYVSQQAIRAGQTERVYASAPGAHSLHVGIYRMGWYGGNGGRAVLASDALPAVGQPPCAHQSNAGLTECDWHPTLSFEIPSALPSGVYIAKLSADTGTADCVFVVEASAPAPLLAQVPTSTYEAYNAWGGDSLYPGGSRTVTLTGTTQGVEVSYDRPYDSVTGAGQFFARDVAIVRFLERYGYPVSYTTSESVDQDPGQIMGHWAVIDFGHSEYWSERQRQAFTHALATGVSLLFFGSDTLAWRVRYHPATRASSEAGRPSHVIVAYKEHAALDPDTTQPTGPFPDRGASLAGSAYLGCITPRIDRPGPPTYRYYAWSPAPGLSPSWLFAGSGITAGTSIPGVVGYELDQRTAQAPRGTQVVGGGSAPCMSAAAPEPGEPVPGPGADRADTTLYTAPSGAIVFDSGTLGWELALEPVPSASPDAPRAPDPRVVAMTRNLLAHVLGH